MIQLLQDVRSRAARTCCPKHLLLVEDNPAHARLFALHLESLSCEITVHWVQDGERALQYLRREGDHADRPRPGLIVLDLKMPRMGGHALLNQIKSNHEFRSIPALVLTTSLLEDDLGRARQNGVDAYLAKPVNLEQLAQVINALMCGSCNRVCPDETGVRLTPRETFDSR